MLKPSESMFYLSQIILAIEYLHKKAVIYRDLKPENIMMDKTVLKYFKSKYNFQKKKGYIKLIDMGTAKILSGKFASRTYTIIGTPHYMAPEVLTGKGYSFSVDYWSIGIILYEFLYGIFPFANETDDPYEIYEEIIKTSIKYPGFVKDKKVKLLIGQLLNKVPEMRLGGSFAALKSNTWFEKFDWVFIKTKIFSL